MKKQNFEDMITLQPQFGPLNADEQPSPEEQRDFDKAYTKVIEFIHGPKGDSVLKVLENAPTLYQGIGQTAFQILLSVKQKMEKGEKQVEPAAFWGEGGLIQTTVDELYQLVMAAGLPEAENQDNYSAAMFEVYRLAGEYIQNAGEDDAINEAQDLLIDVETSTSETSAGFMPEDEASLESAYNNSVAQKQAMMQPQQGAAPQQPQAAPPQGQGAPMPPNPNQGILGGF